MKSAKGGGYLRQFLDAGWKQLEKGNRRCFETGVEESRVSADKWLMIARMGKVGCVSDEPCSHIEALRHLGTRHLDVRIDMGRNPGAHYQGQTT